MIYMEPMRARSVRRRGAEAVDVVMPPHERAKASVPASKHFFLMLLGMQADGGCTHLAFTDGSPSTATSILDAVAKAFLYEPAMEPTLHVRRSVHIPTLRSGAASDALAADRRPFWLMRKRLWDAVVQRRLPAALSKRPRWATGGVAVRLPRMSERRRRRREGSGSFGAGSRQGRRRRAQMARRETTAERQ